MKKARRGNDVADIKAARYKARDGDFSMFALDYKKINSDKRRGRVNAWKENGTYLGQFRSHALCLEAGAKVTMYCRDFYDWRTP